MSTLYLGTDQESLAGRLAAQLNEAARQGDFFAPVSIIVPNRYLGKWLRFWLARQLGVAINLRFQYLESTLWELLWALDPRPRLVERLDDDTYRFMILSLLLDEQDKGVALAPLRAYLQRQSGGPRRDFCRRGWQLADRLARLIRDYEYHRQDTLIRPWLKPLAGAMASAPDPLGLERGQRELFQRLMQQPDGLLARLGNAQGKTLLTLPQYAGEVMGLPPARLKAPAEPRTVYLFGITQISVLHVHMLRWLGERYDLRLFHLNPLVGRMGALPSTRSKVHAGLQTLADRYRALGTRSNCRADLGDGLLTLWGQAGAESLWVMADLLKGRGSFQAEVVAAPAAVGRVGVLARLQDHLLGRETNAGSARLPQDCSVQIVACPGIYREVETVYHSILDNLRRDPTLKQTDVAVLVTDMARYRPVLQAVFDRRPRRVLYNLADFSAAELSAFGHALVGLLDLALESCTRSRVFAVLLNPCFLARLGVDREQAVTWLEWAEALGIYHGWDRKDRQERGYADTALYSWRLGLQRLRLGRLMEVSDEQLDAPASRYEKVIPFTDLASSDKEQLNAFCRAVEGLLPVLIGLRNWRASGEQWADELKKLVQAFLGIPPDRPEEEEVRDQLFEELAKLHLLDRLFQLQGRKADLPLALVREFVQDSLEGRVGTRGEYLTGGVTISALQPLRPVPFKIIYVLGLGEGSFPGSSVMPALDLRSRQRCGGDILPPESNRFLLLEALLAAQHKVYLLYTSRDVQGDRDLYPCSAVNQLRRYLEQQVVDGKFETAKVPLCGNDLYYVKKDANGTTSDVLVNYSEVERLRALEDGRRTGRVSLNQGRVAEVEARLQKVRPSFTPPLSTAAVPAGATTIPLRELRGFLRCPAEAAVRRHLGLDDEAEIEPQDDEPFYTPLLLQYRLVTRFLQHFVSRAVDQTADQALQDWRQRFGDLYEEWRLRSRMPDGAFAEVDRARLEQGLHDRIAGPDGLARFVKERGGMSFCGPVLLGESSTPMGARRRFAALKVAPLTPDPSPRRGEGGKAPSPQGEGGRAPSPQGEGGAAAVAEVRLVGSQPYVWRSDEALDVLVLTNSSARKVPGDQLSVPMLEPLLFYLALKAGTEPGAEGLSSREWLGEREFRLHVAHADGIVSFGYLPGDISIEEARAYLAVLVGDFLDRRSFDLLPFDLAVTDKELRLPYITPDETDPDQPDEEERARLRVQYTGLFQEAVEEDAQGDHPAYRPMTLMEIIDAQVPADAWEKMQRRFRLLESGPARVRAEKKQASADKKARGRGKR